MVSGVNGQPGVPVVRPAVRAQVTGQGNVIHLLLLTAAKPVLDPSLRKRLVIINPALPKVRTVPFKLLNKTFQKYLISVFYHFLILDPITDPVQDLQVCMSAFMEGIF